MNTEELNNFESFEKKQLVLKITGSVQESNLDDFEEKALAVIESIKTDLQTDEDFAEAEQNVKSCKLIETRIAQSRQDAIMQTADIAALIQTTERLEAKFRATRLMLDSKVKTEKELRKNEIVNAGRNYIAGLLISSPVKHAFDIDTKAFAEAAKGKRSLAKISEAVQEVVTAEELRLATLEELYQLNMSVIGKSEAEYPGLFPDKRVLATTSEEAVASQIEARIATYRFNIQEKERKAREHEEQAKEQARINAEKEALLKEVMATVPLPTPIEVKTFVPPPPPDFDDAPVHISKGYTLTVKVRTYDDINIIKAAIMEQSGVYSVEMS